MTRDEALLIKLTDIFDAFSLKLPEADKCLCQKELTRIRGILNQVKISYFDDAKRLFCKDILKEIAQVIESQIKSIDELGKSLEIEGEGVQNFSEDTLRQIKLFQSKIKLKKVLLKMQVLIRHDKSILQGFDTTNTINKLKA